MTILQGVAVPMEISNLFLSEQLEILFDNSKDKSVHKNYYPVAYLSIDKLGYQFLITELDREKPTLAFGLADFDTGLKLGFFDLEYIALQAKKKDAELEPDYDFAGKYPLAVYAMAANYLKTLVIDDTLLSFKAQFDKFAIPEYSDPLSNIDFLKEKIGYMF